MTTPAPLHAAPTEVLSVVHVACPLERVALLLGNAAEQERYIEIWVQPNNLAAVIKAKQALCPGWFTVETLAGEQLPKFVDASGDAWFEF